MADVHIPDDILHNVVARLPAKSLLRFRCVSKYWNCLISDPDFMKSRSCRKMLLFTSPFYALDESLPVDNLAHFIGSLSHFSKFQNSVCMRIAGTFNGIVLLLVPDYNAAPVHEYETTQMILYNPFTRASKVVPDPYSPSTDYHHLYGFCYGETPDDLKIIRFRDYNWPINHNWKTCDVFNLKTSLWSTSEIPILDAGFMPRYRFGSYIGMFINGFLYWVASNKIVALNVEEMVISYVPLPVPYHIDIVWGTLHGCFCMITEADISSDFNVWAMKEHGVENPWSKVHSFRLPLDQICCLGGCRIINIMDDGRILMVDCDNLVIFDTLKHSYKMLGTSRMGAEHHDSHAIEYDESLVSLSDICGF